MQSDQEIMREKILHNFTQNPNSSKSFISKQLKVPLRTVQRVIKKFLDTGTVKRKAGTGLNQKPKNKKLADKVIAALKRNPGLSERELAQKYQTSKSFVHRTKKKYGMIVHKKRNVPRREEKQQTTAIRRSKLLYRCLVNEKSCLIMDDETYVKVNFRSLPGHNYYSAINRNIISSKFKTIQSEKFAKKYLVWQAICQCGLRSKPFITKSTLKSSNYIKDCLEKRLLPFVRSHSSPTLFWPDLASCHYAKTTLKWYDDNDVRFVPKNMNPPNCPELRPIEHYWSIIKGILKKNTNEAKNLNDFKRKWETATQRIPKETVQKMKKFEKIIFLIR